jgi:hypothetical protein
MLAVVQASATVMTQSSQCQRDLQGKGCCGHVFSYRRGFPCLCRWHCFLAIGWYPFVHLDNHQTPMAVMHCWVGVRKLHFLLLIPLGGLLLSTSKVRGYSSIQFNCPDASLLSIASYHPEIIESPLESDDWPVCFCLLLRSCIKLADGSSSMRSVQRAGRAGKHLTWMRVSLIMDIGCSCLLCYLVMPVIGQYTFVRR